MGQSSTILIRPFEHKDREAVRRICCATALMGEPSQAFLNDDELLADALTKYFTDEEPETCFVAENEGEVVGYLIGARDEKIMERTFNRKILPDLIKKIFLRGVLMHAKNRKFFLSCLGSIIKGELREPHFYQNFPAVLHINLTRECRGQGVGKQLMDAFLRNLAAQNVPAVHLATMSEKAARFFEANGFKKLFVGKRSYFRPIIGKDVPVFIYGKRLAV